MTTFVILAVYGIFLGESSAALWHLSHKVKAVGLPIIGLASIALLVWG